ncbi:MAG: hypothetical protein CFE45_17380 [Burkholderiales bacterium PBB5]|nr:MAG: hypothetical protein CFE45_17380 [Burkholderiales bacterium PBB5]
MALPTLEDFTPLCGERFVLAIEPGQTLSAQLVEAQALPQPSFNGRQPFSLVFSGPPAPVLPQRIYQLAHARLPTLDVFLVPLAATADGVRYQAVFS